MELDIKFESLSLIEDLLWATDAFHMDGMDKIVSSEMCAIVFSKFFRPAA
jgi:hypothetical protein